MANDLLWQVLPNAYSLGKAHLLDDTRDGRTMCGLYLERVPGHESQGDPTCVGCVTVRENRIRRKAADAKFQADEAEREAAYAAAADLRRREFIDYINGPKWKLKVSFAIKRAGGTCESCLSRPATAGYHRTKERLFDEPIFDIAAVCETCKAKLIEQRKRGFGL